MCLPKTPQTLILALSDSGDETGMGSRLGQHLLVIIINPLRPELACGRPGANQTLLVYGSLDGSL